MNAPQPATGASQSRSQAPPRELGRNALSGAGRHVLAAVAALAVTPYALAVLGPQRFGVWAVAGVLLATMRSLDLGLERALTRMVARSRFAGERMAPGRGSQGAARHAVAGAAAGGLGVETDVSTACAVATARALLLAVAVTGVAVITVVRRPLVTGLFAVPPELAREAGWVMAGTAAVAAIDLLALPWRASLDGLGRMDLGHAVEGAQRLLSAAGVVVVLGLGWGLAGLVAKNLVTASGTALMLRHLLRRQAPGLAQPGWRPHRDTARALMRHGRWVQVGTLSTMVLQPVHHALLAHGPGLAAVAAYELARRIADQLAGLFATAGLALYPAAAGRRATERDALYTVGARVVSAFALPAFALVVGLAPSFTVAWLGAASQPPLLRQTAVAMALLAVGWGAAILSLPAFLIIQAQDAAGARAAAGGVLARVLTAVALAAWWVRPFGPAGVAAAAAVGLLVGSAVVLARYAVRGAGWQATLRPLLRRAPLLGALAAGGVAWAVAGDGGLWAGGPIGATGGVLEPLRQAMNVTPGVVDGTLSWLAVLLGGLAGAALYLLLLAAAGELRRLGQAMRAIDGGSPAGVVPKVSDGGGRPARLGPAGVPRAAALRPVAAIIPAWRAAERLPRVLDAVAGQVERVIVVDNGSGDGTAEVVAAYGPPVRVLRNACNEGWAAAVNRGVRAALEEDCGALLVLNDDAIVAPGCVDALLASMRDDANAAAATARIVYAARPHVLQSTGGLWRPAAGDVRTRGDGEPDDGRYADATEVDTPSGACALFRAAAWRDVGPMDERLFLYYDDVEWGLRAQAAGWRTRYVPDARVRHEGSLGTRLDPARRRYYNVRNRLLLSACHATMLGRLRAWVGCLALAAWQLPRWPFRRRRREAEAVWWAIADHVRGRLGRSERFG